MSLLVKFTWDAEAAVWVAESDDVPGLVLESGSYDALVERVKHAIPELLELNTKCVSKDVDIRVISERFERVAV